MKTVLNGLDKLYTINTLVLCTTSYGKSRVDYINKEVTIRKEFSEMKKTILLIIMIFVIAVIISVKLSHKVENVEPIAWYGVIPHPYMSEVQEGVQAFEKDSGVHVRKVFGREWTQDNENVNVQALSAKGHRAFSIYPADPAAANALFKQLTDKNKLIVAYGAGPDLPTPASFTVATDIKAAAMTATQQLIEMMSGKGNILNVLELPNDVNTKIRDEAINEVVGKYPQVHIIKTISGAEQVSVAVTKIETALAAGGEQIDGIITTGYNPTIAAAQVLTAWHKDLNHKKIRFIGMDTAPSVIQAISDGYIDATIAQNPFGHGYISCYLLKLMLDGWTPLKEYQFINTEIVVVTKENIDTFPHQIRKITGNIIIDLKTKCLSAPK